MKIEKQLINLIKTASRKPEATDLTAKVLRIEGQTAWVHFDGGAEETPVEMSISCEPGDDVRVRINKGAAYIIGNNTNPPTNDRIIVKYAADLAQAAREVANRAFQNLQELLQTYVNKGSSNIDVLSTAMNQDENGTNVYGDISTAGDHYVKVNESGMDVRRVAVGGQTAETDSLAAHIGTDYVALGERAEGEIGTGSYSEGLETINAGQYSHVEGYKTVINSRPSGYAKREIGTHVEGYETYVQPVRANVDRWGNHVEGYRSFLGNQNETFSSKKILGAHVEGRYASVDASGGHAEGYQTEVHAEGGHAEGQGSEVTGLYAHAEGDNTLASGLAAHTEGNGYSHGSGGVASGNYSHHENYDNVAEGNGSHAGGYRTKATGHYSFTAGFRTLATRIYKFVVGQKNVDKADTLFEVGNGSTANESRDSQYLSNAFEVTESGYIRTGQGMTDIGFGKESGNMGYYEPGSSGAVFTPWVPLVNGKIPETFLPSYVDDVIEGYYNPTDSKFYEESTYQTEIAGERGKIYISLDTDKSYRWSGTVFVELTSGGVVYSAGSGIDISATNEISADSTIARMTDIPTVPTNVSAFTNDAGYLTQHQSLANYIQKSLTAGLVKNDGTIDTTDYAEASDIPDVSNFISKSQTSGLVKNDGTIDTTVYATASALAGYLPLAGGTMTGGINSQNIAPSTDDTYRLGSSTSKYNSAYIKRIYNLASIESTTDGSKRLLVPAKSGTIAVNEDLPNVVGNLIAVNPILTSGTLIANITVSGVSKNLYSPIPDWTQTVSTEPDYIKNKPAIPSHTSDLTNDSGFITINDIPAIPSHTSDLTNDSGFITINDIPAIPDELADLSDDSTHRLVTDTEKSTWNGKQGAITAGTGISLSSANTISIKYYGAHAEAASGGANNNKREGMADTGDGMFLTGSYNDANAPYAYGNILNLNGGGTGQLFLGWRGDSNTGTLYYRSHRDNASASWGPWKQIAYTSDIPSVGNGTLTIQKNGTNVQTFTANQSGNATANIVVPFDYNETSVEDDQDFKGVPHYGKFSGNSSVGELMDGDDGVYMFLPYGTNSLSYGFVLACNDDGNQFYLGSLTGEDDDAINWSRIYHDSYHPLADKSTFIKFPRNAVDYNTAMRSRAKETVAFDELSGVTGHPSYISTFTNPWFNLITMHSVDANYGSQLAIPMTGFTAPAWRYFAGNNFGNWEYIPSADSLSVGNASTPIYLVNGKLTAGSALPDVSTKVSKSGDTMTGSLLVNSNSGEQVVRVQSVRSGVTRDIAMMVGNTSRYEGLWSYSKNGWILYNDTDGNAFFNGSLKVTNSSMHSASIRLDPDAIDFDPDSGSSINIDAGGTGSISMTGYIKLVNSSYTSADTRASYSGRINPSSTVNTYIKLAFDKWALVFLSSSTTSFYALRLLRADSSGTLQSINAASNGTSIVTITYNSTYGIQLKNTNSSAYIHYAVFMIST